MAREHQSAFESLKQASSEAPVLQISDFQKEIFSVTDASDLAISAMLNQRVGEDLVPQSYYSRLLRPVERRYSTYEKERHASLFGCEKCTSYLEHKEFEIQCDNLALCWSLKRFKGIIRLGSWVLRLATFKFRVKHTQGNDKVVPNVLSRVFDGMWCDCLDLRCAALIQILPLISSYIEQYQGDNPLCRFLKVILTHAKLRQRNFLNKRF